MSTDLLFVSVVDDLDVVSVDEVDGASPRTLRVQGRAGFRAAQRVDINGYKVDDFTVSSDRVLYARPGTNLANVAAGDMRATVYAATWSGQHRVRLLFGLTHRTRAVSGVQKLVQHVVKGILSSSGSNRFAPEEGGSLLRSLGQTLSPDAKGQIATIVSHAISTTETNLLSAQASDTSLPLNERLLRLQLLAVDFLETEMEVTATVRLQTMAGATVDIPLSL